MIDPNSVRVLSGGKLTALHVIEHRRNGGDVTREAVGMTVIPETNESTIKIEYYLMVPNEPATERSDLERIVRHGETEE